jgi:thioredoxin-like negative regulator of GroEL
VVPAHPEPAPPPSPEPSGVTQDIRTAIEKGMPTSMQNALSMISSNGMERSEFGRMMTAIIAEIYKKVYPDLTSPVTTVNPPQINDYQTILQNIEAGTYLPPSNSSEDYLELVLPFLALLPASDTPDAEQVAAYQSALPSLEIARSMRPQSVLASYCLGVAYNATGRLDDAEEAWTHAWTVSNECYPAALALAKLYLKKAKNDDALNILNKMRGPAIKGTESLLADIYLAQKNWNAAEPLLASLLAASPKDGKLLLDMARIKLEKGNTDEARDTLNTYAKLGKAATEDRTYRLLDAAVQLETSSTDAASDAAVDKIRSLAKNYPDDAEIQDIASSFLLDNAVKQYNWREASGYVDAALASARNRRNLGNAIKTEEGLKNYTQALALAKELFQMDPSNDEGTLAYISTLIYTGGYLDAGRLINNRLEALQPGPVRSRYYYQRSRLQIRDEMELADLQSARYEDSRNLDALIGLIEYFKERNNLQRAAFYLKQAQAVAPGDQRLIPYELSLPN